MTEIEYRQKLVEATKLRSRAAHQMEQAAAYRRQAQKHVYPGQEDVCIGKADTVQAMAAENRAKADLLAAEAKAEYKQGDA